MTMTNPYLTVQEASAQLGVSPTAFRRYCREGVIAYIEVSTRHWTIEGPDVDALVKDGLIGPALAKHALTNRREFQQGQRAIRVLHQHLNASKDAK